MFKQLWDDFLRAMRAAVWRVVRAGVLGTLFGALVAAGGTYLIDRSWPPPTLAYAATIAVAVLFGYAAATTVALIEGARGLASAVTQLDDVARAAADAGLNMIDAMVDAVDGPERHGFRGLRGPSRPTVPAEADPSVVPSPFQPFQPSQPFQPARPVSHSVSHGRAAGDFPTWPVVAPPRAWTTRLSE